LNSNLPYFTFRLCFANHQVWILHVINTKLLLKLIVAKEALKYLSHFFVETTHSLRIPKEKLQKAAFALSNRTLLFLSYILFSQLFKIIAIVPHFIQILTISAFSIISRHYHTLRYQMAQSWIKACLLLHIPKDFKHYLCNM